MIKTKNAEHMEDTVMVFERRNAGMAAMKSEPKPAQPLSIYIEYHDSTIENIDINYNLEEIQQLFSAAFSDGSALNFTSATPPFSINTRYIKKVTFVPKEN